MSEWGVYSEVGKLRRVLVHQPGFEHRNTIPWNKDALLFDDIMDLEEARPQHKEFTQTLSHHGVEVLFLLDLLKELCIRPSMREKIYREALGEDLGGDLDLDHLRPDQLISGYPEFISTTDGVTLDPLPNLYFARDPAFAVPDALVIANPANKARRREARLIYCVLKHHREFAGLEIFDGILDHASATIEGGDVHVVDKKTVLVGVGQRTNEEGARLLAEYLLEQTTVERVLLIYIPAKREFMHLDTVLTFVDRQRILTMPSLWRQPELYGNIAEFSRGQAEKLCPGEPDKSKHIPQPEDLQVPRPIEITASGESTIEEDVLTMLHRFGIIDNNLTVEVAGDRQYESEEQHIIEALREQWNDGANVLALKPGQVVAYSRNDRTGRALEGEGIEVVSFRGGELVRGRGGARCMTMPLYREEA